MDTHYLLQQIENYCQRAGISPSTLGVRAVGNSRLYERLKTRIERDAGVAARVQSYIDQNPPEPSSSDPANGEAA